MVSKSRSVTPTGYADSSYWFQKQEANKKFLPRRVFLQNTLQEHNWEKTALRIANKTNDYKSMEPHGINWSAVASYSQCHTLNKKHTIISIPKGQEPNSKKSVQMLNYWITTIAYPAPNTNSMETITLRQPIPLPQKCSTAMNSEAQNYTENLNTKQIGKFERN